MFSDVINIKVENAGASAGSWTAFSYNRGGASPSGGAAITVNASPQSMDFAARESQQHPYITKTIKIKVTDVEQFGNNITITGTVGTRQEQVTIDPLNYYSPASGIDGLIELTLPPFVIDGSFGISGTINPNTTMNIVIDHDNVSTPGYPKGTTISKIVGGGECDLLSQIRLLSPAERVEVMKQMVPGRVDISNPRI